MARAEKTEKPGEPAVDRAVPPGGPDATDATGALDATGAAGAASGEARGRRQVKVGRVVSDKMHKTVVVAVENTATHRLYHRYLKKTSKFAAHDEENRCKVGDLVEIVSSRPLSKSKRWRVREILKRAE